MLELKKENRRPRRIEPQVFTIRALMLLSENRRGTTLSSFHLNIDLKWNNNTPSTEVSEKIYANEKVLTWYGSPENLSSRAIAPAAAAPCSSAVLSFPWLKNNKTFSNKFVSWALSTDSTDNRY